MANDLVTLDQAKLHLGLPLALTDNDTDVAWKVKQASEGILNYLKGRAHEGQATASISTSSVANPTVITTVSPHALVGGETVFISGHSDSVPPIHGSYVVSTIGSPPETSSFTIPQAVTTAGTGGSVSVEWTPDTVPLDVQAAVLYLLTHLYENRGQDMRSDAEVWNAVRRICERRRDPAMA